MYKLRPGFDEDIELFDFEYPNDWKRIKKTHKKSGLTGLIRKVLCISTFLSPVSALMSTPRSFRKILRKDGLSPAYSDTDSLLSTGMQMSML